MKSICAGLLAVAVAAGCGLGGFKLWLSSQGDNKDFAVSGNRMVLIKPGMSTGDIAQLLHAKKLVKSPKAFALEARYRGLAGKLQAGMYQVRGGSSNSELVDTFFKGRAMVYRFVVPEGYSIRKIAAKLQREELGSEDKFLQAAADYAPYGYMKTDNSAVKYKAEGFIFPATYEFPFGYSEKQILAQMVQTFDAKVKEAGIKKLCREQGRSLRDVVNLAAMVELEAVYEDEQPRIAGVFLKRLEIGMPIQSDTTIQYLLGKQKEIVLYSDLEIASPYNTYKNPGLPPGPIGSPGIKAMQAVLQPERTDYLYFVAEKDGHHRFTKSFAEHQRAINDIEAGR